MIRWLVLALALLIPSALADTIINGPVTVGPGLTTQGSRVSTFTPQVCDGVHFGSATMTAPSATFYSGQTNFTAADIGKKIAVQGAGAAGATLTTTIAGVVSPTQATLAVPAVTSVAGQGFAYGTDYTAEIQAAITAGVPVHLPRGECGISSTLSLKSNTVIEGYGAGASFPSTSGFLWLGGASPVIKIDTGTAVIQVNLSRFAMHGMCAATVGIDSKGLQQAVWLDLSVVNMTNIGFHFDVSADGNFDTTGVTMIKLSPAVQNDCAGNMRGIVVEPGNTSHELTRSAFIDTQVLHKNGTGLDFYGLNSTVWYNTKIIPVLGGTGAAVDFHSAALDPMHAHSNIFVGFEAGNRVYARAGVLPARNNIIYGWDDSSFPVQATIEPGANLLCETVQGNKNVCSTYAFLSVDKGSPAGTTSTSLVMAGLAGSFKPEWSGRVTLTVTGLLGNSVAGNNTGVILYHGTGTAPANGAATTGTPCGSQVWGYPNSTSALVPVTLTCTLINQALSTAHWFDVGFRTGAAGTASLANMYLYATELP